MTDDLAFTIPGFTMWYLFLIFLGLALMATCISCLAFISCSDCIKVDHSIQANSTSMTPGTDFRLSTEHQNENRSIAQQPLSVGKTRRLSTTNSHWSTINHNILETVV